MDYHRLHDLYFAEQTIGYKILRSYYNRNWDVFRCSDYPEFGDFSHEIFLSLTSIDFEAIQKEENYVIRSMRIQCWVIMDKCLRRRRREITDPTYAFRGMTDDSYSRLASPHGNPLIELAGKDIVQCINVFRENLPATETKILDRMIEDPEEKQIDAAQGLGINVNTLRTKIRRLRLSLSDFLETYGYDIKWGRTA